MNNSTPWSFSLNETKNCLNCIRSWKMCMTMPVWRNLRVCNGIPSFEIVNRAVNWKAILAPLLLPVWKNPCVCDGIPNFEIVKRAVNWKVVLARLLQHLVTQQNTAGSLMNIDPHLTTWQLTQILYFIWQHTYDFTHFTYVCTVYIGYHVC